MDLKNQFHTPVMVPEIISILNQIKPKSFIDCTFGSGGHTQILLETFPDIIITGLDRDSNVLVHANNIKNIYPERFLFINTKFSQVHHLNNKVDGLLFDLGVSSMQIDEGARGFSFNKNGPLTMTMGDNKITAQDIINTYSEEDLANLIFKYGEERNSRKIAHAICEARKNNIINSTLDLANIIAKVNPRRGKIHPATLTFQAIRIAVNEELYELEQGLLGGINCLNVNGILIVISFQGLEDKIIKNVFKQQDKKTFIFSKNVILPHYTEKKHNPRARSAKIRFIKKIL